MGARGTAAHSGTEEAVIAAVSGAGGEAVRRTSMEAGGGRPRVKPTGRATPEELVKAAAGGGQRRASVPSTEVANSKSVARAGPPHDRSMEWTITARGP